MSKPPPPMLQPVAIPQGQSAADAAADINAAADGTARGDPKTDAKKVSYLDLPKKTQLIVLCLARLADPLATTSIQSYMFYQLKFFDPAATDAKVSFQAGIIVGAKTAAQVCTGMVWGRLADSEWGGRKNVLFFGLVTSAIASVGYGLSRSFATAVAWQVFGGALSSNVAMTRCVIAELNPEKRLRTRALLLLPLCANAGMLLGPLVGGLLSSQVDGDHSKPYPYLAPNLFVAGIFALSAVGILLRLEETLEGLKGRDVSFARRAWNKISSFFRTNEAVDHRYTAVNTEEPLSPETPTVELHASPKLSTSDLRPARPKAKLPFWRIWTFNVVCTLLAHFIIAGHLATFSALWAIFLSTPVDTPSNIHLPFKFNGGLGMQPRNVGFAMSLLGVLGVILQAVVYPPLNDRFGTVQIWRSALFIFPIVYVLAPLPSIVASITAQNGPVAFVWLAMILVLILFVLGRTGVTPATTLLINDCTPHPSARGTIHTAGSVIGNLSRSIFPVSALAIFGKGLEIGVVGLGFWFVSGLALLACLASRWVTEGSNGKEIKLVGDEEEEASSEGGRPNSST